MFQTFWRRKMTYGKRVIVRESFRERGLELTLTKESITFAIMDGREMEGTFREMVRIGGNVGDEVRS